jgi:methylated-DNA-[protein]-cysteine S-methyltransferase
LSNRHGKETDLMSELASESASTVPANAADERQRGGLMSTPFLPPADPREKVGYDIVDSPIGRLLLTGNEQALSGLFMLDGGRHQMALHPDWEHRPGGFAAAARQLAEYFGGGRTEFGMPLAPRGTEFQLAVWAELTRIPYGKTASYGEVARALGKSLVASRAVGLANGRNPISIIVPCHRVIGADGSMTGYGGGVERKEWLLGHEGLTISAGNLVTVPRASLEPQGTLW